MLYPFEGQEASYEVSFNQRNRSALGNLGAPDSGVVKGKSNTRHDNDWQDMGYSC